MNLALRACLVALLLPVANANALCVADPVCASTCRDANCGPNDPKGDPKTQFNTCIGDCTDQPNCAGLVTCMRRCFERRDAASARCTPDRKQCIRSSCLICTEARGGAAVPQVFSQACLRECKATRARCRGTNAFLLRVRQNCLADCNDRCGKFPDIPQALKACAEHCREAHTTAPCGDNFQACRAGCTVQ